MKPILRTALLVTSFSMLVAGCGATVTMDPPTIPVPLLEPIPGIAAAKTYEGQNRHAYHLYMMNVTVLGPEDDPFAMNFDAYIEPSIDAFEFSVPNQTRTDSFAVWIRYRIKVWNSAGDQIANWPIAAYGKSQTTALGGSNALQRAAILAMRDAAALMIDKLDRETGVGSTRRSRPAAATAPTPAPAVTPGATGPDDGNNLVGGQRYEAR